MKKKEKFPEMGCVADELLEKLPSIKHDDAGWEDGKIFGFVYHPGNDHARISEAYFRAFMYDSTLNPSTFPSLRNFEKNIISMATELMHGNSSVAGNVTTGGTESIFLALKVARDLAREKEGKRDGNSESEGNGKREGTCFEVILPETIHPAFLKACDHLSLQAIMVPVREDKRADPKAMEEVITKQTIMMCCSAPCFPFGVVDPVTPIAKIAKKHKLLCHVDACMGGFMLPFLEDIGYSIPMFDFRVPGVTSISMDAHKYGYAPKGTSIILYRNRAMRKKQFFVHTDWSGGIFASTTFMGTKSGGPVAGCWAIMNHLGKSGYRKLAGEVMKTTRSLIMGIQSLDSLKVISDPDMSVLAFTSTKGDIYNIGDALESKGWHLDRLQFPEALHLTVTQLNIGKEDAFLKDLTEIVGNKEILDKDQKAMNISVKMAKGFTKVLPGPVVEKVSKILGRVMGGKSGGKQAALYGISASFSNRKDVKKLVVNLLDGMY